MVTNYPQRLAATGDSTDNLTGGAALLSRLAGRFGQLLCGLRGHDSIMHFERHRVTMRCASCGHETPGWEISERGPRRRYEGDPRHHLLVKQRLVLRKSA